MPKTKLSYHDWSDWVLFVMKTRQDNDMTKHIGVVYAENDIELSWAIRPSVLYDENQKRQ